VTGGSTNPPNLNQISSVNIVLTPLKSSRAAVWADCLLISDNITLAAFNQQGSNLKGESIPDLLTVNVGLSYDNTIIFVFLFFIGYFALIIKSKTFFYYANNISSKIQKVFFKR
jgi:hypothetical protein